MKSTSNIWHLHEGGFKQLFAELLAITSEHSIYLLVEQHGCVTDSGVNCSGYIKLFLKAKRKQHKTQCLQIKHQLYKPLAGSNISN